MGDTKQGLEDRVALITGGAAGIGLGIAKAVAERGGRLALLDLSADALDEARQELPAGTAVCTYVANVTDRVGMAATIAQVESDLGPVHALFNNAGVIDSVSPSRMRGETWDFVIDVNLHGVYNGLQAVVPGMIARKQGGFIVNTSSFAGLVAAGSGFAYHASKYAVVGLSESLRIELAHHGISVSVVCPGQVATGIVQRTRSLRPEDAEQHTERALGLLDAAHDRLQADGVDPADAGRSIVDGMLAERMYLFTDGTLGVFFEMRTQQLLADLRAAFPQATQPDLEGISS